MNKLTDHSDATPTGTKNKTIIYAIGAVITLVAIVIILHLTGVVGK